MTDNNGRQPEPAHEQDSQADIDRGLGEMFNPFPKPVKVGEITAQDVKELKARGEVIDRLNRDIEFLSRSRALIAGERVGFIRSLGMRFGLDLRDEFSIDDDNGHVLHLGRRSYIKPEPALAGVPDRDPVEV